MLIATEVAMCDVQKWTCAHTFFPSQMIVRLQKEIADLKAELAMATGEQRTEALTEAELLQ